MPWLVSLLGGARATAFALLATLALAWGGTQTWRLDHAQDALTRAEREQAQAAAYASESARAEEQTRARYMAGVDAAYERGKADANAATAGVLDDVRAGRYVLRDRFKCPAIRSAPAPPPGAGIRDASPAVGVLSDADVQFLVRFAGDAEGVRQQLRACQAVIEADRR